MLSYFQVNRGCHLRLDRDLSPTARVSELCSEIERVSGESAENQVLLTSEGKQMDPQDLIGRYSVGTDEKPIFVFYRSYLGLDKAPPTKPRTPLKNRSLQKQLEMLRQKPTPSLFHHQIALAKQLTDFSLEVGRLCGELAVEYNLQFNGWQTALSNCGDIVVLFKKHQQMFDKAVERFLAEKPHYLELLQQFPQQVELLQKLPLPSSLHKSTSSSLYDWISTHDEKNSLMDLSKECQKALDKIDGDQLKRTLQTSEEVTGMCSEAMESSDRTFKSEVKKTRTLTEEVNEILTTISALNQNIQSTSDKALRAGDAKTIAILVDSHHKSLQLISTHCSRLEAISASLEALKAELTGYVHGRLKNLMEVQRRVKESNDQLRILHEQVKLARQRFEILQQVSSTPQVLVELFGELGRRRSYNVALEKVMVETSARLQKAREEEKDLRKKFTYDHGRHFVTSLFPELQDRVPDISFHAPKSLSKSQDTNLDSFYAELPKNMRPSIQLDTSIHTLLQALTSDISGSQLQTQSDLGLPNGNAPKFSSTSNSRSSTLGPASPLPNSAESPALVSSEIEGEASAEELKELVGKLELNNVMLSSNLQEHLKARNDLKASLEESRSTCADLAEEVRKSDTKIASLEELVSKLEEDKATGVDKWSRTNLEMAKKLSDLEENKQQVLRELERTSRDSSELRESRDQLVAEMHGLKSKMTQTMEENVELGRTLERASGEAKELRNTEIELTKNISGLEERLGRSAQESLAQVQINDEVCKENTELKCERDAILRDLDGVKKKWKDVDTEHAKEVEKLKGNCSLLEAELGKLKENQHTVENKELERAVSEKQQLAALNVSLEADKNILNMELLDCRREWSLEREKLKNELAVSLEEAKALRDTLSNQAETSDALASVRSELKQKESTYSQSLEESLREVESCKTEVSSLKEELLKEQRRCSQAQMSLRSTVAQLDSVAAKRKDLSLKLEGKDSERQALTLQLERAEQAVSDKNSELVMLRSRFEAEMRVMEVKKEAEMKKAAEATAGVRKLENSLNQKEGELDNCQEKLQVAERKIMELETEVANKKEDILTLFGRNGRGQEASYLREVEKDRNEKIMQLRDEHERIVQNLRGELCSTRREIEENRLGWAGERDQLFRRNMELERDLRELQRSQGDIGGATSNEEEVPKKLVIQRGASSSGLGSSVIMSDLIGGVALQSLQIGQLALFMLDEHGNYLALSVDTKTYYLTADCVPRLTDLAPRMSRIQLQRKLLIGRITGRVYMEVRKENNRLKVPLGSRLYKLEAEPINL